MERKTSLVGFGIVVADRGFVYVGNIDYDGTMCVINNAKNIRKWGTTRGLGELALNGPNSNTVIDDVGIVRIPNHAVIHIIDTEETKWK